MPGYHTLLSGMGAPPYMPGHGVPVHGRTWQTDTFEQLGAVPGCTFERGLGFRAMETWYPGMGEHDLGEHWPGTLGEYRPGTLGEYRPVTLGEYPSWLP